MIWIKIYKKHKFISLSSYREDRILVGSSPSAQIVLNDPKIEPICAILEKDKDQYYLHDMKENKRSLIKQEDNISFLDCLLVFYYKKPEETEITQVSEEVTEKTPKKEKTELSLIQNKNLKPPVQKQSFAPASSIKSSEENVKADIGNQLQVVLCWKERVMESFLFSSKKVVYIGSDPKNDIKVLSPLFKKSSKLVEFFPSQSKVFIPEKAKGAFYSSTSKVSFQDYLSKNQLKKKGSFYTAPLISSEMIRIDLEAGIHLYVTYKQSEKPKIDASLFSKTESKGIIYALVSVLAFWFLTQIPASKEEEQKDEKIRRAVIDFPKLKRKRLKIAKNPTQIAQPTPGAKKSSKRAGRKTKEGKTGGARGSKLTKKKSLSVARNQGARVKTKKSGANMKSAKKDPNQVGLLGVFGSKGVQSQLKETYTGSGELEGLAEQATGFSGSKLERKGMALGTDLKGSSGLGKGKSTVGLSNVKTKGRGTGEHSYGRGSLGDKESYEISLGGDEASFSGNIDRGAIYRVIQAHKREVRYCYERGLSRNKTLAGKVIVEWIIFQNGNVGPVKIISSSLGDNQVGTCIMQRLKNWKFPELPQGEQAQVAFPFVFISTNH